MSRTNTGTTKLGKRDMSDEFATYQEYQEMLDDRDDRDDIPQNPDESDLCPHGKYVGGCGIDHMCYWCEMGISAEEAQEIYNQRKLDKVRSNADNAAFLLANLLQYGVTGMKAARFTQDSTFVGNPLTRYGRH